LGIQAAQPHWWIKQSRQSGSDLDVKSGGAAAHTFDIVRTAISTSSERWIGRSVA